MTRRARIEITRAAQRDLAAIRSWLAHDASALVADRVIAGIRARAATYLQRPAAGRMEGEIAPDLRSFVAAPYVVFYRQSPRGIEIVRVLHGARDRTTAWQADVNDADS
jgi:toxin ParE1/3/4